METTRSSMVDIQCEVLKPRQTVVEGSRKKANTRLSTEVKHPQRNNSRPTVNYCLYLQGSDT